MHQLTPNEAISLFVGMPLSFIIAVLVITGVICTRNAEKRKWNNGICKESGLPWKQFDTTFGGDRGYKDGADNWLWVSYNVDKPK